MNIKQLSKQIGRTLQLVPPPVQTSPSGEQTPFNHNEWRLEDILDHPTRLSIRNNRSGHLVELQSDNVKEYRSPDFLILRCQLKIEGASIGIEPLTGFHQPAYPAGSVVVPPAFFRYRGGGDGSQGSRNMWISWSWQDGQKIYLPDGSRIAVPAPPSLAAPSQPFCCAVPDGHLDPRTVHVRTGLVKNSLVFRISETTTLRLAGGESIRIAAPSFVEGFDGWVPLAGVEGDGERFQSRDPTDQLVPIPFGTEWIEPLCGIIPGSGTPFNPAMLQAITAIDLKPSSTYFFYPYFDVQENKVAFGGSPVTSPSAELAQLQNLDWHIPLSTGAMSASLGPPGTSVSGQVGGGKYL